LFYVAVIFLNRTFLIATAGNIAGTRGFATMAKVIYSIMYVVLAYTCANTCFKSISHFPSHSINWMNASGPGTKELGDKQMMNAAMGAVGGLLAGQQAGQLASGIGHTGEKMGARIGSSVMQTGQQLGGIPRQYKQDEAAEAGRSLPPSPTPPVVDN
jgi:hypothetical protein